MGRQAQGVSVREGERVRYSLHWYRGVCQWYVKG